MHAALRNKGIDPIPLDPWYFPTPQQYDAVSHLPCRPLLTQ